MIRFFAEGGSVLAATCRCAFSVYFGALPRMAHDKDLLLAVLQGVEPSLDG